MNCIIVDDDPVWLRTLEEFVSKSASLSLVGSFSDSLSARNLLMSQRDIELIFLDILMPEMDGFDFLSSLRTHHTLFLSPAVKSMLTRLITITALTTCLSP
jgi:DNA-binding NarL/FixJ family response regulator